MIFYIRLLSYENATKLINFVDSIGDYANIVVGGVRVEAPTHQVDKIIEYLGDEKYELSFTHPTKTLEEIKQQIKAG